MRWILVLALICGAAAGYFYFFIERAEAPLPPAPTVPAEIVVGSLRLSFDGWRIATTTETSRITVTLEDPGARAEEVVSFLARTLRGYADTIDPSAIPPDELAWVRESGKLYALDVRGRAASASDGRSSYVLVSSFDAGGAHPNSATVAETYGPNGARLTLAEVVGSDRTLERVADALRPRLAAAIDARVGEEGAPYEPGEDFEAGTDPNAENYANWYLSGDSLVVIVNPYQVGPYALGSYEVAIPLAEI